MGLFDFLKGGGKKTTVTNTSTAAPDAASQAYINQMRQQAQRAAAIATGMPQVGAPQQGSVIPDRLAGQLSFGAPNPVNPGQPGQQGQTAGGFFTGPLTQTPGEMAAPFMDPYQQQVIDATRNEFGQMRGQATLNANQAATQAGAFGGSRHGVLEGTRLGELDRAQGTTIANLLSGGYNNAMTQGMDFARYQQELQQQKQLEPLFRQQQGLNFMNLGMGPVGMQETGTTNTTEQGSSNRLADIAGLATAGLGAYGMYQNARRGGQPTTTAPPGGQPSQFSPYNPGVLQWR